MDNHAYTAAFRTGQGVNEAELRLRKSVTRFRDEGQIFAKQSAGFAVAREEARAFQEVRQAFANQRAECLIAREEVRASQVERQPFAKQRAEFAVAREEARAFQEVRQAFANQRAERLIAREEVRASQVERQPFAKQRAEFAIAREEVRAFQEVRQAFANQRVECAIAREEAGGFYVSREERAVFRDAAREFHSNIATIDNAALVRSREAVATLRNDVAHNLATTAEVAPVIAESQIREAAPNTKDQPISIAAVPASSGMSIPKVAQIVSVKSTLVRNKPNRNDNLLTHITSFFPRKHRGGILCDLVDDIKEYREKKWSEKRITLHILYQLTIIIFLNTITTLGRIFLFGLLIAKIKSLFV